LPPPSLPQPPAIPSGNLNAYGGDAEDDAPTRLYAPGPGGSAPPPPITGPQRTLPRNDRPAPPGPAPAPVIAEFAARARSKKNLYVIGGVAGALVAAAVLFLTHRTGALTITVTGPGGRPAEGVQVFVDGTKRCDTSPCRIDDLSSGAHLVRAGAKGYQETADQAVSVVAGEQGTQNVSLVAAAGTGVRVSALGSGLKLYLDGQEVGELPQTAKDIPPGDHLVRVAGNDRYEPWEEHVTLDEGETRTIGPLKLRVLKGLATFKAGPGADGARVLLDGRLVPELPATIEVPAGKQLSLTASKSGYSTFKRSIGFDDGIAEKTFEITMVEGSEPSDSTAAAVEPASLPVAGAVHGTAASHAAATAPAHAVATASAGAAKGKATVNLNSIPVSNVILNGRPLGQTPKVGVQVTPGPQTVVFVHPQFGRKVMSGNVGPGETKTFLARLK
jgi:serine/threonine-protein kinase